MHRIVKAHLESFVSSFSLEADDEAKQFEKFAAYSVISSRFSGSFDLDDVVTGDGDEGRPSLIARFVATGIYQNPDALEVALTDFHRQATALGIFHEIDIKFVDRDELTRLWVGTYSGINASLPAFSTAALPNIAGIDEAYLAVVKASDFVNNLLTTEDGSLRTQVFEENVRSFLGLDNAVNQSIAATLASDAASRFPVLNNGITIVIDPAL